MEYMSSFFIPKWSIIVFHIHYAIKHVPEILLYPSFDLGFGVFQSPYLNSRNFSTLLGILTSNPQILMLPRVLIKSVEMVEPCS